MNAVYPIAAVAELIGEPARAAVLIALADGRALPAGELARAAGVSAQSASAHLAKLVVGGLLAVWNEGRHRYYRMASPEVGHALEALGAIATKPRASGTERPPETRALHHARLCYDHLAGRLGVELVDAFERAGLIRIEGEREFELGPQGEHGFAALGLDVATLRRARRTFARRCLDWTERRPHLAGALGAALCARMFELEWLARMPKTRALRVTHRGARELARRFGIPAV
jgi:DNA-binding transcriptional ArsR family regulator